MLRCSTRCLSITPVTSVSSRNRWSRLWISSLTNRWKCEAREFLLQHRLFESDRTGEVIHSSLLRFAFPPSWRYNILRCSIISRRRGCRGMIVCRMRWRCCWQSASLMDAGGQRLPTQAQPILRWKKRASQAVGTPCWRCAS